MPKPMRLPSYLPVGSKYIIESSGKMNGSKLMHRYVEFPNGYRVELAAPRRRRSRRPGRTVSCSIGTAHRLPSTPLPT